MEGLYFILGREYLLMAKKNFSIEKMQLSSISYRIVTTVVVFLLFKKYFCFLQSIQYQMIPPNLVALK